MSRARLRFRPGLWPTIAAAVAVTLLVVLGVWQLERAADKRALLAEMRAALSAEPVELAQTTHPRAVEVPQAAVAVGRYDGRRQLLLDNQTENGRVGYRVLTPLRLQGRDVAVLVDRGWIPAPRSRKHIPRPPAPRGLQRVSGVTGRGPSVALQLGAPYTGSGDWPRRVNYMDFGYFADALPYPVLPFLLEPEGRDNPTVQAIENFGPSRHVGYAVQWFAMAGALAIIYLVANLRRRRGDERN